METYHVRRRIPWAGIIQYSEPSYDCQTSYSLRKGETFTAVEYNDKWLQLLDGTFVPIFIGTTRVCKKSTTYVYNIITDEEGMGKIYHRF